MNTTSALDLWNALIDSTPGPTSKVLLEVICDHPSLRAVACQPFIDSNPSVQKYREAIDAAPELHTALFEHYLKIVQPSEALDHLKESESTEVCNRLSEHLLEIVRAEQHSMFVRLFRRFVTDSTAKIDRDWNYYSVTIIEKSERHRAKAWALLKKCNPSHSTLRRVMMAAPELDHKSFPMYLSLGADFHSLGQLIKGRPDSAERLTEFAQSLATSVDDYITLARMNPDLKPLARGWLEKRQDPESFVKWFVRMCKVELSMEDEPLWRSFLRTSPAESHLAKVIDDSVQFRGRAAHKALSDGDCSTEMLIMIVSRCKGENLSIAWNRLRERADAVERLPRLLFQMNAEHKELRREIAEMILARCTYKHDCFEGALDKIIRYCPELREQAEAMKKPTTRSIAEALENLGQRARKSA